MIALLVWVFIVGTIVGAGIAFYANVAPEPYWKRRYQEIEDAYGGAIEENAELRIRLAKVEDDLKFERQLNA